MKCPKCKVENLNTAKFCMECGHKLMAALVPSVKHSSLDRKLARYKRDLTSSPADKHQVNRDKKEGERRQVTVMFCDMEGFTKFVEKIGPEEAFVLMDQIYEILIRKVHEFGGTVNEMTGDGIMAFFGAPVALENAPLRSLRSALSIHNEIDQFNLTKNIKPPVRMRIGINTGRVVTGTLGNDLRFEFKAVGDTVNLASRMEGMAEPGTTYLTENTFKLVEGRFRFKALGYKEVKGKKHSVLTYRLLSANENLHIPRQGFERQLYSKMMGRDPELEKLEHLMSEAIGGKGAVVNIIGEAGIGKSRLIAELNNSSCTENVTILEGRAISFGMNISFHLVIDIFRQWAQIGENDNEALALRKLQKALKSLFPEDFEEVLPFLATLLGMKLSGTYAERLSGIDGEALENLILKNVRNLIIKATELAPLVIVMEDLHWADTSSIMLLESLLHLAETQRILFINVFRPGYKKTGDRISRSIKEKFSEIYVEIQLEPLDRRMSKAFITNLLDIRGLHPVVIKDMIHKTGGNPFFIEEVVRSLIDEGAIIVKDGIFEVTERISKVTLPTSINDVLMTRIDRVEKNTRDLLKLASVIGRRFFYRVLSEVASDIKDIDGKLTYLTEIEILRQRERKGELEYFFKHALAQEAAYESILPQKRRELHRQVAASIEKVFEARLHEFFGMLAYHYSRAEDLEKTEEYLIKAGQEALKSSASNEALNFYQEALELYLMKQEATIEPEKVAMIEKNIALAYYNRGHYEESIEYFEKALRYYWGPLPSNPISKAFAFIIEFTYLLYCIYLPFFKFRQTPTARDIEAVDLFTKKLKALAIINPMKFFLESFHFYKRVWKFNPTEFDIGIGLFVGASTLFSFSGMSFKLSRKILDVIKGRASRTNPKAYIIYDFAETMHNYFEGDWKSIVPYDEELVNQNLSVGELYWTSQHYFWHGNHLHYQGQFDLTHKLVNHLLELSHVYGNDLALLLKYLLNTNVLIDSGKLNEALIEIEAAIEFGQIISQGSILIEMYSRRAHIQILKGHLDAAEESLKLAEKVSGEIDTVPWQCADLVKGKCELDLYRLEVAKRAGRGKGFSAFKQSAKKSTRKMLRVAGKVAQNRTESYLYRGVYCWLIDRPEEAFMWWRKSIAEGDRLGARLALSRTYFEIGKRLASEEQESIRLDGIEDADYLEKASAMFEEMALHRDLDELNTLRMA